MGNIDLSQVIFSLKNYMNNESVRLDDYFRRFKNDPESIEITKEKRIELRQTEIFIKNIKVEKINQYSIEYKRLIERYDYHKRKIESGKYSKQNCKAALNNFIEELKIFKVKVSVLEECGLSYNVSVDQIDSLIGDVDYYKQCI